MAPRRLRSGVLLTAAIQAGRNHHPSVAAETGVIRALVVGALLLPFATAATAFAQTDIGTCLTAAGLRIAPWTDGRDPACGADCGPDGIPSTADDGPFTDRCVEGDCGSATALALPAPKPDPGPRCLTAGPGCDSDPGAPAPGHDGWGYAVGPLPTAAAQLPRRASGTLPGADPVWRLLRPVDLAFPPATPPPRASRAA
jgi:hypothetical protein